jgi:hypothetical protein
VDAAAPVAQTEAQLLRQVGARGWSAAEQERLVTAHALATRIFAGRSRVTGKPFLGHVVRTASYADDAGERRDVVLAALLHAAYTRGDFADGTSEVTPAKRATVSAAAGPEAELIVFAYATFPFGYREVDALTQGPVVEHLTRDVLAARLANLLDELLEREHWKYQNPEQFAELVDVSILAARHQGMERIAARLELGLVADDVVRPKRRLPRRLRHFTRRAILRRPT